MLKLKDFGVTIENTKLIHGIDLELGQNERIGILGLSGSGKSLTFQSILGLNQSVKKTGELYYKDKKIKGNLQKYLRKEIGYITQDVQNLLNPYIPILKQMMIDLQFVHKIDSSEAKKLAVKSLERLGIKKSEQNKYPDEFSGGMKQRVVISMILNRNPQLLIADEISSSLDKNSANLAIELIEEYLEKSGMSLIYISHNPYDAIRLCHRIYIYKDGEIIEHKKSNEIFETKIPEVQELLKAGKIIYG